ncbi:RNA polymerase sigma-70 factor (ECF subfamily) [Nakamurella sp. UYEF19]|uniref:RNA polymerase sigma factor n=1 Tax=Nakamurella sp. UYEF19 TaxID=1756392 RepID=UPI003397299A
MTVLSGVGDEVTASDDRNDFADWVSPHRRTMAWLIERLAPWVDRDDVLQEAVLRAWVKRGQFDPSRGSARSWLCAIAADQARKAGRKSRPPQTSMTDVAADGPDLEGRLDVEQAVATLPARQRLAVDCFYFVGLSVAESAVVMACSEGTVKSTLSAARARLRSILEVDEP